LHVIEGTEEAAFSQSTKIDFEGDFQSGRRTPRAKIRKMNFPPKMVESKNKWYHQEVLLKSVPVFPRGGTRGAPAPLL
jgi:hypothetical protein